MATVARVMEAASPVHSFVGPLDAIEHQLMERIGVERYELWFEGKTAWTLNGEVIEVAAGNAFAANWIRAKFASDLRAAAESALARAAEVRIIVKEGIGTPAAPVRESSESPLHERDESVAGIIRPIAEAPRLAASLLNAKYTLEEFVVGASNQMAYQAAVQVAQNPGTQFNPLFIHGACGLGKTHLLQGICQRFARLHPGKKWLYLTGEQFTNEFLEAIKTHKTDAFRRKIRGTDLLVIDDVHFLANKKATQEEFLHTFNQIDAGGKQVVLASDCAPKAIAAMADALVNRFVSGMVLRVDAPELATRLEILRRRAARNHWQVSDAVLMHIASSPAASVRELEGMLLQAVAGLSLAAGETPGDSVLAGLRQRTLSGNGPVAVEKIVNAAAEHFGVTPTAILASGREKTVSIARAVAMYLARLHTGMSYPEIGRAIGNKNHSTVIAACQRVEALMAGGELICWKLGTEVRHQAMADLVHALESNVKKRS